MRTIIIIISIRINVDYSNEYKYIGYRLILSKNPCKICYDADNFECVGKKANLYFYFVWVRVLFIKIQVTYLSFLIRESKHVDGIFKNEMIIIHGM